MKGKMLILVMVAVLLGGMVDVAPAHAAGELVFLPLDIETVEETVDVPPTRGITGWTVALCKRKNLPGSILLLVELKRPIKSTSQFVAVMGGKKVEILFSYNNKMVTAYAQEGSMLELGPKGNTRKFLVTAQGIALKK